MVKHLLLSYSETQGDIILEFSNQLKKYRKINEYSQTELAEKLYVSSQTISNWENERSYPDIHNLILLSTLFNISLDELIKGDVSTMKNLIDQKRINKLAWLMLIMMLLTSISIGPVLKIFGYYGLIITLILGIITLYFGDQIDRLKYKYQIKTYKEIVSFMETGKVENNKISTKINEWVESLIIVAIVIIVTVVLGNLSLDFFK